MEKLVELTPLTVGQFRKGYPYEGGVIKEVGPAEMVVEYSDDDQIATEIPMGVAPARQVGLPDKNS